MAIKHLKPRSEEELKQIYKKLTPSEKIHIGIELGIVSLVKDAIKKGADIHTGNEWYLKDSCDRGLTDIVELILADKKTNIHDAEDYALRHASYHGYYDIVRMLLEAGADVHANADEALEWAIGQKEFDVVKLLKQYGAKQQTTEERHRKLSKRFS